MAKEPRSLSGQVAAITGGGRGIGRATAEAFVREGIKVAICDIDLATAQRTASELGGGTVALEADVTDRASFKAFLDGVEAQLGPVDILVNNAGIMPIGPFLEESDATAHRQININLHGVLYGMKLALPGMITRGRGHVINLASMAGKVGLPGGATYCATKHAVVGASEAVRQELRGTGVEISIIMPGLVNTELTSGLGDTRAVKRVNAEDVADAIVDALKFPRFDVFVPKSAGLIQRLANLMPRSAAEAVARALKADKALTQIDTGQRRAYEDRAAHSAPGLEPEALPAAEETALKPTAEPVVDAANGQTNGAEELAPEVPAAS
jgi:NADP-dependent 3-hydroxy acid dehydrogenase YdfG